MAEFSVLPSSYRTPPGGCQASRRASWRGVLGYIEPAACGEKVPAADRTKEAAVERHLLLIDCPDETGLIWKVTGVLFRRGFNIITNHEFVDRETVRFFM